MTRLYNDYSSIANLNSVSFLEFHSEEAHDASQTDPHSTREIQSKESVLSLARYERSCVEKAFQALVEALGEVTPSSTRLNKDSMALFIGVGAWRILMRICMWQRTSRIGLGSSETSERSQCDLGRRHRRSGTVD